MIEYEQVYGFVAVTHLRTLMKIGCCRRAFVVASLAAVYASVIGQFRPVHEDPVITDAMFTSLSFLLGILIVFQTSQCYNRYWDGTTVLMQMVGDWFDTAATLLAFTRFSSAPPDEITAFRHTVVRLLSMLNAMIMADLEGTTQDADGAMALNFPLLDADAMEAQCFKRLRMATNRPGLVFQWIQNLLVDNIKSGVLNIPPPVLTRSFQALEGGMLRYHDAQKYASIPFPFPYTATTEVLLIIHFFLSPWAVAGWAADLHPTFAGFCTFVLVFVLWSLHFVAHELQNPFGTDLIDLPLSDIQEHTNSALQMLLSPSGEYAPQLRKDVASDVLSSRLRGLYASHRPSLRRSFRELAFSRAFSDEGSTAFSVRRTFPSRPSTGTPSSASCTQSQTTESMFASRRARALAAMHAALTARWRPAPEEEEEEDPPPASDDEPEMDQIAEALGGGASDALRSSCLTLSSSLSTASIGEDEADAVPRCGSADDGHTAPAGRRSTVRWTLPPASRRWSSERKSSAASPSSESLSMPKTHFSADGPPQDLSDESGSQENV